MVKFLLYNHQEKLIILDQNALEIGEIMRLVPADLRRSNRIKFYNLKCVLVILEGYMKIIRFK